MTTQPTLSSDLAFALDLADRADRITTAHYLSRDLEVETKPDDTPVTRADRECESALRKTIVRERPNDGIWGEELGRQGGSDRRWIIDPIDGTANYLRGVPVWATLIGLQVGEEFPTGVISAPALGRRWWATAGEGAFTRDVTGSVRPISVSGVSALADASFSFSDEVNWEERGAAGGLRTLLSSCWRTRAYGDFLSHVLVAEGAVDIAAEPALYAWDMAALIPIVTMSGGTITAFDGGPPLTGGCAVTTNGQLHEQALTLLRSRHSRRYS